MADGRLSKCKLCAAKATRTNYRKNREYYLEYERSRAGAPHRLAAQKRYAKENPDIIKAIKKRWAERNPEKMAAIRKANNKKRYIEKEVKRCSVCGTTKFVHGHHDDYSRPFDVIWLCAKHHKERHAFLRAAKGRKSVHV